MDLKKQSLLKQQKIPGFKIKKKSSALGLQENSLIITSLSGAEVKRLLQKNNLDTLDLSAPQYRIENDSFLKELPANLKEIDLAQNSLVECLSLNTFVNLKRLILNGNQLTRVDLHGLVNLEYLSLANNKMKEVPDMTDLKKLLTLDLSYNAIVVGYERLSRLNKTLKCLDFSNNNISMAINEFYSFILLQVKKLGKLEYLTFGSNPIETNIKEFKFFIINEMQKIKFFNYEPITSQDKSRATKLENEGAFDEHLLPTKESSVTSSKSFRSLMIEKTQGMNNIDLMNSIQDTESKSTMLDKLLSSKEEGEDAKQQGLITLASLLTAKDSPSTTIRNTDDVLDNILSVLQGSNMKQQIQEEQIHRKTSNVEDKVKSITSIESIGKFNISEIPILDDALLSVLDSNIDTVFYDDLCSKINSSTSNRGATESLLFNEIPDSNFISLLSSVIKDKEANKSLNSSSNGIKVPEAPTLVLDALPKTISKGPTTSSSQELDINYLDLLEDIMNNKPESKSPSSVSRTQSQDILNTTDITNSTAASVTSNEEEVMLDKLIREQQQKLIDLLDKVNNARPEDEEETDMPPYQSNSIHVKLSHKLGVTSTSEGYRGIWKDREVFYKYYEDSSIDKYYMKQEVQKQYQLNHNNLSKIYAITLDKNIGIIREYVSGISLHSYLVSTLKEELNYKTILKFALDILTSLEYLHTNKVIHMSLKPKNVLISKDGILKLTDYGYVEYKDHYYRTQYIQPDFPDIQYIAPEVLFKQEYNESIDIYSFGWLLYSLIKKQYKLFEWMDNDSIVKKVIQEGGRPDISELPYVFQYIIHYCWQSDYSKRPSLSSLITMLKKPYETLIEYSGSPISIVHSIIKEPSPFDDLNIKENNNNNKISSQPPTFITKKQEQSEESSNVEEDQAYANKLNIVLSSIREYLQSPSDAALSNACKKLLYLIDNVNDSSKYIIRNALFANLLDVLTCPFEALQEQCLIILNKLIERESEEFVGEWKNFGNIGVLLNLMEVDEEPIILQSTKLITKLITIDESIKDSVYVEGGLKPFVGLLKSENELLQTMAVWSLSTLLESEYSQEEFLEYGGLSALFKLLFIPSPSLQLRTLTCLGILIQNNKATERIVKAGVLSRYWGWISTPTPLLQGFSLKYIIIFLKSSNEKLVQECVREGGVQGFQSLVSLLFSSSLNDQLLQLVIEALTCYLSMSVNSTYFNDQFRMSNGISQLLYLLTNKNDVLKLKVLELISKIIIEDNNLLSFRSLDGINKILSLLNSNNENVLESSLTVIKMYIEKDPSTWESIIVNGAVQILLKTLLRQFKIKTIVKEAATILSIIQENDLVKDILEEIESIKILLKCLDINKEDISVQESVIYLLSQIELSLDVKRLLYLHGIFKKVLSIGDTASTDNVTLLDSCLRFMLVFAPDSEFHGELVHNFGINLIQKSLICEDDAVQGLALKLILLLIKEPSNRDIFKSNLLDSLQKCQRGTDVAGIKNACNRLIAMLST